MKSEMSSTNSQILIELNQANEINRDYCFYSTICPYIWYCSQHSIECSKLYIVIMCHIDILIENKAASSVDSIGKFFCSNI